MYQERTGDTMRLSANYHYVFQKGLFLRRYVKDVQSVRFVEPEALGHKHDLDAKCVRPPYT